MTDMQMLLTELDELREENRSLRNKNAELMQQKANLEREFFENVSRSNKMMEQMKRELEGIREVIKNKVIS